jgi:hypothetical protein
VGWKLESEEWIVCRVGSGRVGVGVLVQLGECGSVGEAEESRLSVQTSLGFCRRQSLSLYIICKYGIDPPSDLTEVCLGRTVTNKPK